MGAFFKKLTSRKFLAALVGAVSGLAVAFSLNSEIIASVSGAVLAGASLISYIVTEGRIDAQRTADAIVKIQEAGRVISGAEEK